MLSRLDGGCSQPATRWRDASSTHRKPGSEIMSEPTPSSEESTWKRLAQLEEDEDPADTDHPRDIEWPRRLLPAGPSCLLRLLAFQPCIIATFSAAGPFWP